MRKRKESDNNIYDLTSFKKIGKCTVKSGHTFKFDKADYDLISRYKWRYTNGYIVSCPLKDESKIGLQRYLMQGKLSLPENKDKLVCFRNHNTLDFQRHNLILLTKTEMNILSRKTKGKTSEVKGVSYVRHKDKWFAYINIDGIRKSIGYFKYEEQAIIARLKTEHEFFGPYAPQKNLFPQYGILTKSGAYSMGTRLHAPMDFLQRLQKKRTSEATQKAWEEDGYTDRDLLVQYYIDCTENTGFEDRLERDLINNDLVSTYANRLYIPEAY